MKKLIIVTISILLFGNLFSQDTIPEKPTYYPIIGMDSPTLFFTMRQMNQNYLSLYRYSSEKIHSHIQNKRIANIIEITLASVLYMPITHEEGHRSVLAANNIGSISQPYFNSKGAAYVVGVTDSTLVNLRDNDLPTYIRLHTAGLESDYMLTKRVERIAAFEFDKKKHVQWEYLIRKLGIMQYYAFGLLKMDIDIEEEENELERDIVGHDIYGAAKHLYRPGIEFYRYTDYSDLNEDEKKFIKRTALRSFLNLMHPLITGRENFDLSTNLKFNVGLGYTMAPFGDFIDETFYFKFKDKLNLSFYLREFQNKTNWFLASGIGLYQYYVTPNFLTDVEIHYWNQPKDLQFNTKGSEPGGAVDVTLKYKITRFASSNLNAFSIDLGLIYKTKGFLPEEMFLDEHLGFRIGASFWLL